MVYLTIQHSTKFVLVKKQIMEKIINIHKEILGGTPVFMGTRVPIKNLFDYLEDGEPVSEFLDDFPTVKKEQAEKVIKMAHQMKAE